MPELSDGMIMQLCSPAVFDKGKEAYKNGCVTKLEIETSGRYYDIYARVKLPEDRNEARVHISFYEFYNSLSSVSFSCLCDSFHSHRECVHVAAVWFALQDRFLKEEHERASGNVLEYYTVNNRAVPQLVAMPKISLLPQFLSTDYDLLVHEGDYPRFTFRIGCSQMYTLKNIPNFLMNVKKQAYVKYGKKLAFKHELSAFNEISQQMIYVMMAKYPAFCSENQWGKYTQFTFDGDKDILLLTGHLFDQWFDVLKNANFDTMRFFEEDPKLPIRVEKQEDSYIIRTGYKNAYHFFGDMRYKYMQTGKIIYRVSESFYRNMKPLVETRGDLYLNEEQFLSLCTHMIPKIAAHTQIEDPLNLITEVEIQTPYAQFYLDDVYDTIECKLKFVYKKGPDQKITVPEKEVIHNESVERWYHDLLMQCFAYDEDQRVYYFDESMGDLYDFLEDTLPLLGQYGEIYASETLQHKKIAPSANTVGVSVSEEGMLTLSMDTGEFPPEELEALYDSLLKKKKYHRLKDGRYLSIYNSGYDQIAQLSHMLQLDPKELENGEVMLPAYRALYLEEAFQQNEDLHIDRDEKFKNLIQNFKAYQDSDYQLPNELDGVLRPYQKVGYQWLKMLEANQFGGILADEMGLGKTLQTISFLSSLKEENPSLIVCPASLLYNWKEELSRFAPQLSVALFMGSASEREQMLEQEANTNVWVISYDLLRRDIDEFKKKSFACVILDEAQYIKNKNTKISKAVKLLNCRYRLVLTGTPIENRLSELWNLFDFLMPGYLYSHHTFVERMEKPIVKSGNEEAMAQLQSMVQPFILRRLKKDVLKELPDKIDHVRRIQLSPTERKVYLAAAQNIKKQLGKGDGNKMAIFAALTQMRQICCDPHLAFENYKGEASKLEACLQLCEGMVENGHQILLFSQFTSMLEIIKERLDELGISNFTLQGSTPKEKRASLVKEFNEGKASVFLISLKAGGTGLNLTSADVVIHYDPWWNVAAQNQATDRTHRIGQDKHVHVYRLIAKDTIEEKILDLQDKKAQLMEAVSSENQTSLLEMSKEDLLALL
jgi:superfamily II DNA or RNA helicase